MKRIISLRCLTATALSIGALVAIGTVTASASVSSGAVTRTFSFIGKRSSATRTLFNIDSLLINARCDASGNPVVYAFTSARAADIFGRIFDASGRVHILKNTSFTNKSGGVRLSWPSGDFDATGSVLFETSTGNVVTVNIAFDNSTTLVKQNVCTVFGSVIAS